MQDIACVLWNSFNFQIISQSNLVHHFSHLLPAMATAAYTLVCNLAWKNIGPLLLLHGFNVKIFNRKCARALSCLLDSLLDVPCLVSRWSSWTPCSMMCGRGKKTRTRRIIQNSQNRGRACPKLTRSKSCRGRNCTSKY